MKWKLIVLVVFFVALVKSVPLAERKVPPVIDSEMTDVDPFKFTREQGLYSDADDDELNYRLPNNSRPLRYDLFLTTGVHEENFEFGGIVKIQIEILEPTTTITLHQRQLTIIQVDHLNDDGTVANARLTFSYEELREFLTITLPEQVNTGAVIILQVTYGGYLRTDNTGFYRASYNDTAGNRVWFATTQFEMVDARHGMPCYDEPGIRAVMAVSIEHGAAYTAISNSMMISSEAVIDKPEYVVTKFADTIPMQTYLLAFVISDYKYVSNNEAFEQRVYARPQMIDDGRAEPAISIVGPIHNKLQEVLGVELPITKMDHAAIYDYRYGAMENMGLITYTEAGLLTNPVTSITTLIAHEYTHQYFGDLVAPQWWAYTWLNEGFATIFSNYISEKAFPGNNHWVNFANVFNSAFNADLASRDAKPLNFYVQKPLDIEAKFGTISYQKGGSVLRTFMEALTEPVFLKGLNYYITEMQLKTATPKDLHRNLQKAYDEAFPDVELNVDAMMSTWEDQAGYPNIHVAKLAGGFVLTQSRFGGGSEIYAIPVSYATSSYSDFGTRSPKLWMTTKSVFLDIPDSWMILNVQASSYYKVSYDSSVWLGFLETLHSVPTQISTFHRTQLHQNVRSMLIDGTALPTLGLSMMKYMDKEEDSGVWGAAANVESFYWGKLFGSEIFKTYLSYVNTLPLPHLNRLTLSPIEDEPSSDANLRNVVSTFSCKVYNDACLYEQLARLQTFLATNEGTYDLCSAVRYADDATYTEVINRMLIETIEDAKNVYIQNLGCSMAPELLNKFFDTAIDATNSLTENERRNIFSNAFGKSTVALDTAIQFLRENFDAFEAAAKSQLAPVFSSMSMSINTETYYAKMKTALDEIVAAGFISSVNQAIVEESARAQKSWLDENEDELMKWFGDELNYRLPNNSMPLRYDLFLTTGVHEENFEFGGIVKIRVKILEPTTTITLHQRQLTIIQVDHLNDDGTITHEWIEHSYEETREFLTIKLPALANTDDEIVLKITYGGYLRTDNTGFYRASYNDTAGNRVWFATTQFEMVDARHGMPCYDEPGIRAVMAVSIEHGAAYTAISNSMMISSEAVIDKPEYVVTKFADTIPMQTYLLAFVISDYKYVSNNEAFEQRVYARPQMIDDGRAEPAISIVGPIHNKLQEVLGVELPITKMDHAAIYDYRYGAMENMGLITYTEAGLLTNPVTSITTLIAHEYTHQYFGDLVAPQWWAYTWLNEGFATIFSNYISEKAFPGNNHWVNFANVFNSAFNADLASRDAKPLNFYVQKPLDIEAKFGTISYQKGGSVLRTFMEALTEPVFLKGLNYYITEMQLKTATPKDLHRNLQKAYDEAFPDVELNVDAMMSTWEDQAGYPNIHVAKLAGGFVLTQSRFGGGSEIYAIPLSYATTMSPDFTIRTPKLWLNGKSVFVDTPDSWMILNIDASAYYKVTYDKSIWPAFFETLNADHTQISTFHRAQLHQNVRAMLIDGTALPTFGFSIMQYLNKEVEPSVWNAAANVESFYWGKLLGTDIFEKYLAFVSEATVSHMSRLTYVPIDRESAEDANLRNAVIAVSCMVLSDDCLNYQLTKLETFLSTGSGDYELCGGVRKAGDASYSQLITRMLAAQSGNARNNYIQNLGCSLNSDLLKKLFATTINTANSLTATERANILTNAFGKSPVALETAIEYLQQSFADFERVAPAKLSAVFTSLASYINTQNLFLNMKTALDMVVAAGYLPDQNATVIKDAAWKQTLWHTTNKDEVYKFFGEDVPVDVDTTTTIVPPITTPQITTQVPTTTIKVSEPTTTADSTTEGSSSVIASFTVILVCAVVKMFV